MNEITRNKKTTKLKKEIEAYLKDKALRILNKKKPSGKEYTYTVHNSDNVLGIDSGYDLLYLVGDNWLKSNNCDIALMVGFNDWKLGFTADYLPEYRTAFLPRTKMSFLDIRRLKKLKQKPSVIIVWGYTESQHVTRYAKKNNLPIYRMEDAFIRSAKLGAQHATPYSLVVDKTGFYYNCYEASDIENILNTYDFKADTALMQNAQECIQLIKELKLSKYNPPRKTVQGISQRIKLKRRVAILGQVDSDASIKFGNPDNWTSEELIKLAAYENPNCEIYYRPHPEVYQGFQDSTFKASEVEKYATITTPDENIIDFIEAVDHIYTISSLSGFEAVIRNKKVTTVGAPFYSGWGVTDDRVTITRRTARLTIEEVFAAAYLIYPRYLGNLAKSDIGLKSACYKVLADAELAEFENLNIKSVDKKGDSNSITKHYLEVAKGPFWPTLFLGKNSASALKPKDLARLLRTIRLPDIRKDDEDSYAQEVIILALLGSINSDVGRNQILSSVRNFLSAEAFYSILIYLEQACPANYISYQLAWLLSQNNEQHETLTKSESLPLLESIDTDKEHAQETSHNIDELPLLFDKLKYTFENRMFTESNDIAMKLLVLNYKPLEVLKYCQSTAELKFSFKASLTLAEFRFAIDPYYANRDSATSILKANKYSISNDPIALCKLYIKILVMKPELVSAILFDIALLPDTKEKYTLELMIQSVLNLVVEKSRRTAQAYLMLESPEKAINILESIIEDGDHSEMTKVIYSQALSYNGQLERAKELVMEWMQYRITKTNITEMMRLCVLSSDYRRSLEYLNLANSLKIQLGDMHKRKSYFGNRMLKEAFETFTEIGLAKKVQQYFPQNYCKLEDKFNNISTLFVIAIFGPGDEIRFASIYNLIKKTTMVTNVTISCTPRLKTLFSRSFPDIKFISVTRARNSDNLELDNYQKVPGFDIIGAVDDNAVDAIQTNDGFTFVTDLLHVCLPSYESFPRVAYLKADIKKVENYKARIPNHQKIIGISWRSSLTTHSRNEHYLTIEELKPLFELPNVTFINLQYDECTEEIQKVNSQYPGKIINFEDIDQYNDFDSVAALMMCCDLIISPATTVVELAGALGCNAWLFSNSSELDWRKTNEVGQDVWHSNVKIIDVEEKGNKEALVEKLRKNLMEYINF
ncbi:hypothetical protein Q4503_10470 [Colwellia sp. 6_MG-2023]|uniref:capsular polysaccharide export protein, LipB/KpsS family n=1 Tax=Colwellia sp. 6_MG-2023 TaxID=3062676 RepID=UPI0026E206C3|nr:hypothetical protein [Colwellia sp. 6_MG-2023]MDO6488125.1 hypothetical protein [Colwellia sp. 6_MG-2023]